MSGKSERLRSLFKKPELQRLMDRLRERRVLGRPLTGVLTLQDASSDERRAIDQLLRRPTSSGFSLGIPLDDLLQQLRRAKLADSWSEVLDIVCGPPDPDRALAAAKLEAWEEMWSRAQAFPSKDSSKSQEWLERLRRDGALKRLSRDEPTRAEEWLKQASDILSLIPFDGEILAGLAVRVTGNSHALDSGAPLSSIVLRGIALAYGCSMPTSATERRELWSKAGIICDELSAPVLTFNLTVGRAGSLTELLSLASEAVVPLHLTTKLLRSVDWSGASAPVRAYVCENPSLVALAVRHLGGSSAPLICVDGEPKTAGWLLLQHLRDAGTELWYHGDFDWKGVAIASRIIDRVGATPWRYTAEDYLAASGGDFLEGCPAGTPWCPRLAVALRERQVMIHEESLAQLLLQDLQVPDSTIERRMQATCT